MQRCELSLIEEKVKETVEKVGELLKIKRENNDAKENCAHLVKYTIHALENLFEGKEPPDEEIPTESSVDEAENTARLGFVSIKAENNGRKKELRTLNVTAHRQPFGLNSILPPNEVDFLFENDQEQFQITSYVDLVASSINKKCVKLADIELIFKEQAAKEACVLIGHIGLTSIGKSQIDHVIGFCATSNYIYYIDGQLYNGIDRAGCPVFQDLSSQFDFTTQYDSLPRGIVADDCFYLIHRKIPHSIMMENSVKKEKEKEKEKEVETDNNMVVNHPKRKFVRIKKEKEEANDNKKRKIDLTEQSQFHLLDEQNTQIKLEKIKEETPYESTEHENEEIADEVKIKYQLPTFEEIQEAIYNANRLARMKDSEIMAINEFREIIADIKMLKQYADENFSIKLSARACHCHYQILQCQKNAGFLSLAMPQVKNELKALIQELQNIVKKCQTGIPCAQRDTYTISMANSALKAISWLLKSAEKDFLDTAESSLKHAATLIEYLVSDKINELKIYFKSPRENATVSDYIEQAIELLEAASHFFEEMNQLDKLGECDGHIRDLKNLLKQFLPEPYTFFGGGNIVNREGAISRNNEFDDKGKEKLPRLI